MADEMSDDEAYAFLLEMLPVKIAEIEAAIARFQQEQRDDSKIG